MKVLIAGDLYISDDFIGETIIDSSIENLFSKADYRIVNLESPLTEDLFKNKILKTGPHLRSNSETTIPFLNKLNINLTTLANNHILDYGEKGLNSTFRVLNENQIDIVGAGNNLLEASLPFSLEKDNLKIAFLNFTENEWSVQEEANPGANPLDIIENVNQIKVAKLSHDKVICIIHGGHEYCHLPSPRMVKQYRFYVDNGADAIIGHHTHCVGGYEYHNGVPIIYSLGNFIFTIASKHEEWYKGLIVELNIEKEKQISFNLHPIQQELNTFKTKLLVDKNKQIVLDKVNKLSSVIINKVDLYEKWDNFLNENSRNYLSNLPFTNSINYRYLRGILNRLGFGNLFLNVRYSKFLLNLIRCEAHLDGVKRLLTKKLQ